MQIADLLRGTAATAIWLAPVSIRAVNFSLWALSLGNVLFLISLSAVGSVVEIKSVENGIVV